VVSSLGFLLLYDYVKLLLLNYVVNTSQWYLPKKQSQLKEETGPKVSPFLINQKGEQRQRNLTPAQNLCVWCHNDPALVATSRFEVDRPVPVTPMWHQRSTTHSPV